MCWLRMPASTLDSSCLNKHLRVRNVEGPNSKLEWVWLRLLSESRQGGKIQSDKQYTLISYCIVVADRILIKMKNQLTIITKKAYLVVSLTCFFHHKDLRQSPLRHCFRSFPPRKRRRRVPRSGGATGTVNANQHTEGALNKKRISPSSSSSLLDTKPWVYKLHQKQWCDLAIFSVFVASDECDAKFEGIFKPVLLFIPLRKLVGDVIRLMLHGNPLSLGLSSKWQLGRAQFRPGGQPQAAHLCSMSAKIA